MLGVKITQNYKNHLIRTNRFKIISLCLFCVFFLGNTLSISNYGAILSILGVENAAPIIGTAKELPGLDLEPYIYTPMYQIAVNNEFERYNKTSLFSEDLRSLYALPIADWGLIFKPNMWAFFILPPEYAYSLLSLISLILFFWGYSQIAKKLGASRFVSFCLVTALFFSGFVFYWWLLFGFVLALFPWLILNITKQNKRWFHYVFLYYLFCCFLISNFYPPLTIGLVFVAAILILILRPQIIRSREFIYIVLMAGLAVATVVYYLWDAIELIKGSTYPGDRVAHGGQSYPAIIWLGHFYPSLLQYNLRSITSVEAAEQVGISSYFFLLALFFSDYKTLLKNKTKTVIYPILTVSIALILMWAWMLLPLPSWVGSIFLWDHVQPRRLQASAGLLIFVLTILLIANNKWQFTPIRIGLFSLVLLIPWYFIKFDHAATSTSNYYTYLDLMLIPVIIISYSYARFRQSRYPVNIVLIAIVIINILEFGSLQQLQPARPIFNTNNGSAIKILDAVAKNNPDNILALNGFEGTVLNGLGYKSVGHAFFLPTPEWYRQYFPELNKVEYNNIFNRTSSVRLFHGIDTATAGGLGVNLPIDRYGVNFNVRSLIINKDNVDNSLPSNGAYVVRKSPDGKIMIDGWAKWNGLSAEQNLTLYTKAPIQTSSLKYAMSRRGGNAILSGFHIELSFNDGSLLKNNNASICLVSSDPKLGSYKLTTNSDILQCNL